MKFATILTDRHTYIQTDRWVYLDVLKIISAFFIIFYHFGKINLGIVADGSYIPTYGRVIENITVVSIPVFFMVNGALIFSKEYSLEKIYGKAAKIALLTFVWEFTAFPSWFFKTLIVLYLLYPALLKVYKCNKLLPIVCTLIFIFPFLYNLIIILIMKFCPEFSTNVFGITISLDTLPNRTGMFTMYSILYLFLGAYLSKRNIKPYISVIMFILGIIIVTLDGTIMSVYKGAVFDSVNGCFPTVGALIAGIGVFSLIKSIEFNNIRFNKLASYLGSRVLYTYLFHMFFIHEIMWKHIMTRDNYNIIVVLLVSILVYLASMIVGIILEKIPIAKYLVKI